MASFDTRAFRDALGRYPTGVTIVTTFHKGDAVGVTVNSFASVSLDPPLVLWSVERGRERYPLFKNAKTYAINVLAADQSDLASACAEQASLDMGKVPWSGKEAPLIDGAVARFVCQKQARYAGGDHDILVGRVMAMDEPRDTPALEFYRGGYGVAG